ncbi:DEAD/DEAH box helicase family protein [Acinetobacter baumannii]|uniref:DEAD/DEAH box helicase n=1 Tax=Acinetobacter TaxID=469 RepID=UPI000D657FBC|nr:DEAD/DEAH box helicase family protein [Acinetobacter baumannii]MCI3942474.1 DEAD/DEAH box helicase family protein [Acinetobacter baumannii]TPS14316.1 DEAD/DEAH box helicase [Acinetobacter baumannii]
MANQFSLLTPNILQNSKIREPQIESYKNILSHFSKPSFEREVGIVLPVGCGKSGAIGLTPFALKAKRALVIAPNLAIAEQLYKDFTYSRPDTFYKKCEVLIDDFPEPAEIRGKTVNKADLIEADVVVTNIQQLQGDDNRWLNNLESDFFDLIIFDEAHHNVAETWQNLKDHFPQANIVNFSATPLRADGRKMAGDIIYSYSVQEAIKAGYVKSLKAVQLNPENLKFVRDDGKEQEVPLEEVIKLGEEDSKFRKSIITSTETLNTIVDASIHQLYKMRKETDCNKLKIIASALNYTHCKQIVAAYKAKGLKADFVHSLEDTKHNAKVYKKLESHELDVIVQVRKLGEGFDHPYLSVAAVFSIFGNLSPFVQFIGRVMRVIEQNNPNSILNHGVIVYHAGGNIIPRWNDFKEFSAADQQYFESLLPTEYIPVTNGEGNNDGSYINIEKEEINVIAQTNVKIKTSYLLDDESIKALELLKAKGVIPESYNPDEEILQNIKPTKVQQRQAKRTLLDALIKNKVGYILSTLGLNAEAKNLDKSYLVSNFVFLKSKLDQKINALIGIEKNMRNEMTIEQIELAISSIEQIAEHIILEEKK